MFYFVKGDTRGDTRGDTGGDTRGDTRGDTKGKNKDYIEKFWVGLLEGDGSIVVRNNRKKQIYGSFEISLKNLPANVDMLQTISQVIGGRLYYEKKKGIIIKVKWIALANKDFNNCVSILNRYPLLTTRKICQYNHLQKCFLHKTWDYHLKERAFKYKDVSSLVNSYNKSFPLPSYYPQWLSGFIEAEGCFRYRNKKRTSFYISQNSDFYILNSIRKFFHANHTIGIQKDSRTSMTQYRISFSGKSFMDRLDKHLHEFPLLGEKRRCFLLWQK